MYHLMRNVTLISLFGLRVSSALADGPAPHALISQPFDCSVTKHGQDMLGSPHFNLSCILAAGGVDAGRPSVCDVSRTKLEGPDGVQSDHESFEIDAQDPQVTKHTYTVSFPNGNFADTKVTVVLDTKTGLASISDGPDRLEKCHKHVFTLHAQTGKKPAPAAAAAP